MRIPAEDHVAESETGLRGAEELVAMQILAAQDAVDVADGDLDLAGEAVGREEIGKRLGARLGQFYIVGPAAAVVCVPDQRYFAVGFLAQEVGHILRGLHAVWRERGLAINELHRDRHLLC